MRINDLLKRPLHAILAFDPLVRWTPASHHCLRAAATDARVTFTAYPVLAESSGSGVSRLRASQANRVPFSHGVLPLAFFTAGVAIADMGCRERRAGTLGLIQSAPLLKAHFVWWKLAGRCLSRSPFCCPLARVAVSHPTSLVAAAVGLFLVAAMATSLAVISVTPKTFTVVFLTTLYIVTSDRGASRELDFGGFYGVATPSVTLTYVAIAFASLVAGQGVRRRACDAIADEAAAGALLMCSSGRPGHSVVVIDCGASPHYRYRTINRVRRSRHPAAPNRARMQRQRRCVGSRR